MVSNGSGKNGMCYHNRRGATTHRTSDSRIPDLSLTVQHPKRAFIRRALEFEIRLSYHDRILKTLPQVMQEEHAHVIAAQAPGPDFEYEEPSRSFVIWQKRYI